MARSVNKIILLGNVGGAPELLKTASGKPVAHLSLTTSRRVPRGDGFEEWTEWHRVTLWDRLAQFAADYVRRGDRVYAEGRIEYGSFEKNGLRIPTAEVVVQEMILLGAPGNGSSTASETADPSD